MSSLLEHIKRSPVAHLLMTITFFTSAIILNILQGILYYFLRPFWKYAYRKLNYYLCYSLYSQLVFMAEWWSGSDIVVYTDKEVFKKYFGKEHAFLILNHTYDIDWLIGWIFCDRVGVLGNCKAYAKKSIQYVPTMGWAWKFSESVFLERNWDKDKDTIGRQVAQLCQYPDPMFLLLFAEGTRFTEDKHKASVAFATEKGLPILKHHLNPRTKGFTSSLPELRGKVPAIYNIQMCFDPTAPVKPTVMNLLLGKPVLGHMFFERIPVEEVPEKEEDAAQWLRDLYCKKDKMMESFLKTGDYFKTSGVPRVEAIRLNRRPFSIINMSVWAVLTLIPMVYCLTCLLTSGSTVYVSIGLIIISVFFILLYLLIEQTKIDKGSSYGKTTPTTPTKDPNGSNLKSD
ncbi:1-acyl-sn-glycerol-3-phosphate acyltransferase gamma-like [Cimex lectularius]|uniref:Phospholipid/glycerol acyltransferase domain-containing protein n=1 Tax=Cimex lectularius TaxID=79782 RepID=A0A8I6RF95_CIMLE|nr:1-acyl-sn-glycerol-3-phosphate acyltransferase gamma-like [Cimex lectularius]XP_014242716.1 1-acyl-sn-glycerol-3-phosphate acyltransferase gamma-like [Cimex lectularius]XP_014242718.1 1-acyl-sn-glycerol-3-phosphate acyltransferase gamma-like [Cimex lectularius]XP_014242719.1 1-acyl-sn-glycerol-3-phosphate acyltransferase gamma-like [Cimex lectularius]XP_014242721.1 1-acyl-sn-glycerol-3-phosphate acyltransferase gamma-like [Cimex lectularius]